MFSLPHHENQNLEDNRNNICRFPITMKPKTGGQNNHIGKKAEEGQFYKNIASQYEECEFCFLNHDAAKSMKCNSVCCHKCSVWYHEIRVGAKSKKQFIGGSCH